MPAIKGVFTALITPFFEDGSLNQDGLRTLIRGQISKGIHGIVVLGTTGEAPTLSEHEKVRIIQIAKEETAGRIHLMVGTGGYSTEQTIRQSRLAEELGADSCLVITPYYNKPNQTGLYLHYKAIAESIRIPLMIYHHPGRTGCRIEPETLLKLSDILNIIGIKEASSDINTLSIWMEKIDPNFSVFSGDDMFALPLLSLRGHGVISVASNLVPGAMINLVCSALKGDFASASEIHYRLVPLFRSLAIDTNPIPIKAAMNAMGFPSGPCRLPLTYLSENDQELLKKTLPQAAHG